MPDRTIPAAVRERLPIYLHYLRGFTGGGKTTISSAALAKGLGLGEVQVRKDLALVSGAGKPKIGYDAAELTSHLENALGIAETNAVIVGAGRLGKALLCYEGFNEFGLHILAAFDKDESKCSFREGGKLVLPIDELKEFCEENEVKIGVICVLPDSFTVRMSSIWIPAFIQSFAEIKPSREIAISPSTFTESGLVL